MPIKEEFRKSLTYFQNLFMCADGDFLIKGNFNSDEGKVLNVKLTRCHDRADCHTEEEIDEFFRGKYFVILYN